MPAMPADRSRRQMLGAVLTLYGALLVRPGPAGGAGLPEVTVHASPT